MARLNKTITPENRLPFWKKLWATPKKLDQEAADAVFDEFMNGLIPRHMHKIFLKSFGAKKEQLNNRFFLDDATFQNWETKLQDLLPSKDEMIEATVIYGSSESLEAFQLRGQPRRSLKDVVMDDWQASCALVRAETSTLYVFVDIRMRGCIVRLVKDENEDE